MILSISGQKKLLAQSVNDVLGGNYYRFFCHTQSYYF